MADALSDLRYISRMGYQDPWAEATKSISDSLLAYGQSKLKRDALIKSTEEKTKQDTIRAEDKESARKMMLWNSIDKNDFGTKKVFNNKYGTNMFGDADISSSISTNIDKGFEYHRYITKKGEKMILIPMNQLAVRQLTSIEGKVKEILRKYATDF